jgi:hypothetical protein
VRVRLACALAFGAAAALVPRVAEARSKSCQEVSDVVGEQQCTRYGYAWSVERMPGLSVGLGAFHREYEPSGHRFAVARTGKRQPTLFRFDGDELDVDKLRATGAELRVSLAMNPYFYVGTDVGVGAGPAPVRGAANVEWQATTKGSHIQSVWGIHVGGRIPLGRVAFRIEALSGAHFVSLPARLQDGSSASATAVRFIFEPRVWADVWLSSSWTLSPYVGAAAFSGSEKTAGVMFTWHLKAFDGDFSL